MDKMMVLDNGVYVSKDEKVRAIREYYDGLGKGGKSRFLALLCKRYDLVPYTMLAKFKGHNNFSTLESNAIYETIKKLGENEDEG